MRGRGGVIRQGTHGSLRGHAHILEGMQTPCSPFLKENDPSLIKCESVGRIRMWPTTSQADRIIRHRTLHDFIPFRDFRQRKGIIKNSQMY